MSDDLKQNLRGSCYLAFEDGTNDYETAPEAADRIEELEAANKLLNEQLDSIEEMGTESLNALPDCLMQLAPALVENDQLKDKLAKVTDALSAFRDFENSAFYGIDSEKNERAAYRGVKRKLLAALKMLEVK